MSGNGQRTRRQFLRAAAAVSAAPYFVSSIALGRGPRRAANDRIAVGFIGVGNMGGGHLGGFLGDKEVQVVAICDVDTQKREKARERTEDAYAQERLDGTFRGCETYNEFEKLLARDDIDAVLIAVPDHWHATIAIAACRAGKDVYCEKPLALTVREAWKMAAAARRYNTVFQTGSQQRSSSNFRLACELVQNGRIGKLIKVNVGVGGPSRERYLPEEPVREGFLRELEEAKAGGISFEEALNLKTKYIPGRGRNNYYRVYETKDGLVAVACLNNRLRRNLRDVLGVEDPSVEGMSYDWFSEEVRVAHRKAAEPYERAFRERTTADLLALLGDADVPCGRVKFPEEMYDDEHVRANGLMLELEHPVVGRLRMPASPVRMSATPPATPTPPPALGADGPDVLRELGVSDEEIAQLLEDGVLVTRERLLDET